MKADDALALPDLEAIRAAGVRIAPHVHRTPVLTCRAIDAEVGARLHFKCENFQKVGAFKARGACNAVFSLAGDVARRGVVTHSSGNHGAALAYAAARRGIPAWVVMPDNAPQVKQANVRRFGATIRLCAPNVAAREAACADVQRETGALLVHPFDDVRVIAGQGTAALELLEDRAEARFHHHAGRGRRSAVGYRNRGNRAQSRIRVYGRRAGQRRRCGEEFPLGRDRATAERDDDCRRAAHDAFPRTLAALRAHVSAIGTASEDAIVRAMRMIWERMKIVVEPSSAVPLACLLERTLDIAGAEAGIVLTGGNVDLDRLPWQP